MQRIVTVLVVACVWTLSLGAGHAQSLAPTNLQWRPIVHSSSLSTDEIFPSEILALAAAPRRPSQPTYLGDPNGVLGVLVRTATSNTHVQVSVKVDQLSELSTFDAVVPEAGRSYEIWPKVRFDARALSRVQESFPTTVLFTVSVDGAVVGQQSQTIRVRSINDVPFAYVTTTGQLVDSSFLFAAFVNENSAAIDSILKEALRFNAIDAFAGYQRPPAEVVHQVFAVWNVLQRRGVKYSSITQPSGASTTVFSQHVRFLDEVVNNEQANCVDGSVLFASVLYKLGIYPALVNIPGHMFVGFFADRQKQQPMFLETTLIGAPPLTSFERNWRFLTSNGYRSSRSYQLFDYALQYGNQEFQKAMPHLQAKERGYALIDVDAARHAGIAPIPRF